MLADIPPLIILPIAFVLPVLIIIVSFRLNFILHASILLIVFLLGSVFAGATGLVSIYRHVSNILQLNKIQEMLSLLYQSQTITRTLLSTVSSAILIVKFLSVVKSTKETEPAEKKMTVLDLFRPMKIGVRTLNMCFQWFSVTMCYYGLAFASTSLSGDPYSNFFLRLIIIHNSRMRRPRLSLLSVFWLRSPDICFVSL